MGARLLEIVESIEASRARVLGAVEGLDQAALDRRTDPDAWSIGEILHHLQLVERFVARLLEKQLTRAQRTGVPADTGTGSALASLDPFSIETAPERITAPAGFVPSRGAGRGELLDSLAASHAALLQQINRAQSIDLARIHFPHPVLGMLDMYQWILYVGQHELRHLHQIERTTRRERSQ